MRLPALVVAIGTALVLAGCGGATPSASTAPPAAASATIGAERCQQNRDAGHIVYLTSYDLGGAAGVLAEVTAKGQKFYEALCLDVEVRAKADNNAQLVSAGTAQLAGMGSASDVLAAQANGAKITGIGTFGNVGQVALLTMAGGPITKLTDLAGKTLGYKGTMPAQLQAMLLNAGVDVGAVKEVSVGFDPRILPQGKVDALQGYKDNEPGILAAQGHQVTVWDPAQYGVKGTFSTTIVNTPWASAHPTAVEDFLRATYHAFEWIRASDANLDAAIAYSQSISQAGYDAAHERTRWQASSELVVKNLLPGHGVGFQSTELWQPEADALVKFGITDKPVDVAAAQTAQYVDAIYQGATLVWPAPGATGASS